MDNRGYRKTSLYYKGNDPEESRAFSVFKRMGRKKIEFLTMCVSVIENTYNVDLTEMTGSKILSLANKAPLKTVGKNSAHDPARVEATLKKPEEISTDKVFKNIKSRDTDTYDNNKYNTFDDIDNEQAQLLLDGLDIM